MTRPNPLLFALYRNALQLYPSRLRLLYQDQMLQTVRDAHAERSRNAPLFWLNLFTDLFQSCIEEHTFMIRNQVIARPIFFHAVILGLILTLMGGAAAATFQGLLRNGADQPQIQMADTYASEIASGAQPERVIPPGDVDLQQGLEPFAIFYNDQGVPVSANGHLNQAIPTPPPGVFAYVRVHGSDRISWQPQRDVRIAAILRRVNGPNPGFVLAGRSLRVVEEQVTLFFRMVFIGWFVLVVLLIAGGIFLNHAGYPGHHPASAQT
jgi:hypothetical protein